MRLALAVAAALLATPAAAQASGGGLGVTFGGAGATVPGHDKTYVAISVTHGSLIQAVKRDGGAINNWRSFDRHYGIPAVAYDGSTTGLSADSSTLVLAEAMHRYPPRRTRLIVLDADTLKPRTRLSLPGYYSVDAVSPDGRFIYLVRYTAPVRDINRYEVMVYDLENPGAPDVVVDPEEPDEQMAGMPFARAMSDDGRWAYTFYSAEEPFIHALDTENRTAKCIDLPQLAGRDVSTLKLKVGDGALRLERQSTATLFVDTRTFEVSAPRPLWWPCLRPFGQCIA